MQLMYQRWNFEPDPGKAASRCSASLYLQLAASSSANWGAAMVEPLLV
jgi:hypothetical protein